MAARPQGVPANAVIDGNGNWAWKSGYTVHRVAPNGTVVQGPGMTYSQQRALIEANSPFPSGGGRAAAPSGGDGGRGEDLLGDPARDAANRDALAVIKQTLADYGLPATLADWAWGLITSGASASEVLLELRNRPEFKAEFPEIEARQKAGLAPLSPGEIVSYRRSARQLLRSAGLPEGFYDDKKDFTTLLVADVSLAELNARVQDGYAAALRAPAETRQELSRLYGVGEGALAAFFIDPNRALPVIQRQVAAAQIGGASKRAGFGLLGRGEAERLGALGVSEDQAEAGFGALAASRELFDPLVGQEAAEDRIDRATQLGAAFEGNVAGRERIDRQRRKRQASFEGGGGFGASRSGFSGLGSAEG
jgi:hypothetical protein